MARSVRSQLSGRAGPPDMVFLLFGHGAATVCERGTGGVCIDPLKLSASVHEVEIAVLSAAEVRPCHRSVAVRIHGIGAIDDYLVILPIRSIDVVLLKGAGRGRERDETDDTEGGVLSGGAPAC